MRDSDKPMSQREAYQRGYAAGYAAAQSGPPREPTQAMLDAGTLVYIREQQKRIPKWEPVIAARFWRAMHDAWAQEQPAATPSTGRPDAGAAQAVTDGPAADLADLCARLRKLDYGAGLAHDAADELERLARENAKWNELHRTIAEELGYSAETWPDHRNAPLAIAAAFVLSKQRVERAEAERAALRECVRAADAMALECRRVGLISSTWLEDYDDARAKVTLP